MDSVPEVYPSTDSGGACTLLFWKEMEYKHKKIKKGYRKNPVTGKIMAFFTSAINILQTLVVAIGAGLAVWGVINLLEGYGNDNRATRS